MLSIGLLEVMAFGVLDHYVQGRLDAIGVYPLVEALDLGEMHALADNFSRPIEPDGPRFSLKNVGIFYIGIGVGSLNWFTTGVGNNKGITGYSLQIIFGNERYAEEGLAGMTAYFVKYKTPKYCPPSTPLISVPSRNSPVPP
jgi:hypothetical protein